MIIPNDLHYLFPAGAYLLFVAALIFAFFFRLSLYRDKVLVPFASSEVLQEILIPRSRYNFWAKVLGFSLTWMLATLALMQPRGNGHYPLESGLGAADGSEDRLKSATVQKKAHDVVFLVDASASMSVEDTRQNISRLDYAKEIVDEVVRRLKGESVALYAFTSDTTKLSPPTMDYLFVRLMLKNIGINEGDLAGTNVVEAISDMKEDYFSDASPKLKTLIVLTDGGDTHLESLRGAEREEHIQSIINLLDQAEKNNVRVFTIGLGTEQGKTIPGIDYQGKPVVSQLDENLLQRISHAGRGEYYFANGWTTPDIASDIVAKMGEEEPILEEYRVKTRAAIAKGQDDLVYDLYFQYPLALAIFILGTALFFPDTRIRREMR